MAWQSWLGLVVLVACLGLMDSSEVSAAYSQSPPVTEPLPCDFQIIEGCNRKFKAVFAAAKQKGAYRRRGKPEPTVLPVLTSVYCRALQTFMTCLSQRTDCAGSWLEKYRYVVLEHGMMDKKCAVCPHHDYAILEQLVHADTEPDYVGRDTCSPCARRVHKKCVKGFRKKLAKSDNMCDDVQEFISCYTEEDSKEDRKKSCSDAEGRIDANHNIVKHFANLCSRLGEEMLKKDKSHPGLMC